MTVANENSTISKVEAELTMGTVMDLATEATEMGTEMDQAAGRQRGFFCKVTVAGTDHGDSRLFVPSMSIRVQSAQ